ncbi:MAG TPA: calcium/proton exchanger [Candidatus Eisenbacteria bacterium]|nr:calcium/proton exchanger [Candidatus Eisenbacteria bacterium]
MAAARRPDPALLLRALLAFVALAPLAAALGWPAPVVFACAALAIVPLAALMGGATEALAARLGAGAGGLLNATFGNAAELVLALVALQRGYADVVKASLAGSILGNLLLVLGLAMVAGGARRERQTFDRVAASASSTLLLLAAVALLVPAAFHLVVAGDVARGGVTVAREGALERGLSLEIAVVLAAAYLLSLLFSLGTHAHRYAGAPAEPAEPARPARAGRALATLAVATALVAWMSELLVGAIGAASHALGLTPLFVGVVVVAVVGNAAEHATAVGFAIRDRMDLALHVAVGSSLQIALFVAPLLVFVSYALPHGPLDLRFSAFEVVAVLAAVGVVGAVAQDGESNWLEGALLLAVYAVLALAFFFLP